MKGLSSRDGKMSGNRQMVESYDKSKGHKPAAAPSEHAEPDADDKPMHEVVAEHGPAKQHLITKGEDGGFTSHTMHEDGHKHGPIHHGSMEEAHQHGSEAMGGGDAEHDEMGHDAERHAARHGASEMGGGGGKSLSFMD